jgi:hypothetical protein
MFESLQELGFLPFVKSWSAWRVMERCTILFFASLGIPLRAHKLSQFRCQRAKVQQCLRELTPPPCRNLRCLLVLILVSISRHMDFGQSIP